MISGDVFMTDIVKIVLTGGPCAGKTAAMACLTGQLVPYGVEVFPVYEQATALMQAGDTPESMGSFAFHRLLFRNQLAEEEKAAALARQSTAKKALVLCDRGLLDSRAYVSREEFAAYAGECGLNEATIRNRYDAVFHMVTAACGAEAHYSCDNNTARSEDLAQARALDQEILSLWVGTQHLRVVDNRGDFADKLDRLQQEVLAALGIPEPLEIERKFLIAYPDLEMLNAMPACRRIPITQAYLHTPEEGLFRVRKRGEGEDALYIKTVKHKINDMKRIEMESYISKEEYRAYVHRTDCVDGVVSKDRYCFVWQGAYFELDVYPFWNDRATLELELLHEAQPFTLPGFLTVLRDVTTEKEYRNKHLAVVYGNRFSLLGE